MFSIEFHKKKKSDQFSPWRCTKMWKTMGSLEWRSNPFVRADGWEPWHMRTLCCCRAWFQKHENIAYNIDIGRSFLIPNFCVPHMSKEIMIILELFFFFFFRNRLISVGRWPARRPILSTPDFFLQHFLKILCIGVSLK